LTISPIAKFDCEIILNKKADKNVQDQFNLYVFQQCQRSLATVLGSLCFFLLRLLKVASLFVGCKDVIFFVARIISLFVSFIQSITKKRFFINVCELEIEQLNLFNLYPERK